MLMLVSRFFCWLPLPWALGVGRAVACLWCYLIPIRLRLATKNVERALGLSPPQCRAIVHECVENLAFTAVESLRLPLLTQTLSEELVHREGIEHYESIRARGRGVIGVVSHLGNFDLLAASQAIRGLPIHAVVRDLKPAFVNRFVLEARHRTGYQTIPARRSRDQIRAILARGEIVAFIVDQHMPSFRGIVCEFFGQLASTTPAPVRFALETGAGILPAVIFRSHRRGQHLARMGPEFILETPYSDLQQNIWHNTQRLNHLIESWIREAPGQWLWLHRRWKVHDDPEGWTIPPQLQHLLRR